MRHDSSICVLWLIRLCAVTDSCVWHDSFIRRVWLIHMCDMTHSYVWQDSFICVSWLIHMCDMTHSVCDMTQCVTWLSVWHDSVCDMTKCVIGLSVWHDSIMFDMAHLYARHDSFIRMTWLIHMCDMTHSCLTWLN